MQPLDGVGEGEPGQRVPAAKEEQREDTRADQHVGVLGHEEERPFERAVFRVESSDEVGLATADRPVRGQVRWPSARPSVSHLVRRLVVSPRFVEVVVLDGLTGCCLAVLSVVWPRCCRGAFCVRHRHVRRFFLVLCPAVGFVGW